MTTTETTTETTTCPVCGTEAEAGCIYAGDRDVMYWREGPPSWVKNIFGLYRNSRVVGRFGWMKGVYAPWIYCPTCRHIILPLRPEAT